MLSKLASSVPWLPLLARALPNATASTDLFQDCPDLNNYIATQLGIQGSTVRCANISVPLDYTLAQSAPLTLNLFQVPATKTPVLGSVIINFGGPGGTGAENLKTSGALYSRIIGPQWNLVSWDPRGTGKTIPFDCKINTTSGNTVTKRDGVAQLVSTNLTDYLINGGWEYAGQIAEACAMANTTGQYISTAFTARDAMKIVDYLNEDGLLRYFGVSYGTALGHYLVSMFPERAERVILDANINPYDYQNGTYGQFLADTDKVFYAFLGECIKNKNECELAQYTKANTADDILKVINAAFEPIATTASTNSTSTALYNLYQQAIINELYTPVTWPWLAGNITAMLKGTYAPKPPATPKVPPYNLGQAWATIGIRAGDALWRTDNINDYIPVAENQDKLTGFDSTYPSIWISTRWKITAKEQYKGNFSATTKHPILYVNGEYDPVTPLRNAYAASKGYPGSVVLRHTGYGHGIFSDPSTCVFSYTNAYYANGTLPPPDTECNADKDPWSYFKTAFGAGALPGIGSNSTGNGGSTGNQNSTGNGTDGIGRPNAANHLTVGAWTVAVVLASLSINL